MLLARPLNSSVVGPVGEWLRDEEDKRWVLAAGTRWEREELGASVLIAFPDALSEDPLAMAVMGLVRWARSQQQLVQMVERLGPVLVPAIFAGQWEHDEVFACFPSWLATYGDRAEHEGLGEAVSWAKSRVGATGSPRVNWSPWPGSVAEYREQLEMGIVPHQVGGQSPLDAHAVLLALSAISDARRPMAAGLCGKALLGRALGARWRVLEEEQAHGYR